MTETQEAPPGVCPVHFDHYTQEFAADPWTPYAELRTTQPMGWSDQQGGFWVVTSDELIRAISKDHEHFFARFASVPKGLYGADLMVWPPMTMDPPEHTKVKKLMLPAFTPGRAKIFEPDLREFCRRMVEGFAGKDVVDVSHDYARRIPMYVISKMLGVTSEMEDQVADWLHRLAERSMAVDRPRNDHMAFGAGTHKCLGAWVARMELRIGLEEFLKVYPDFEFDDTKPMRWAAGQVHGPRQVPVRLPR